MSDPGALGSYRRAIARAGVDVTFERWTGAAPNRQKVASADIRAVVRDYAPDGAAESRTGIGAGRQGAITAGDRLVIALADDLAALRYPLPVAKHDKVIVKLTGEMLDVAQVDPFKRAMAGAIELKAMGTQ